jgi:ABC-2 type transport system ATP-binding protein
LLWPNGAGKTTTLNMMQGVLKPDSGRITIFGMDYDNSASKIKGRIGVQLQSTSLLPDLTAIQQIMLEIFMGGK